MLKKFDLAYSNNGPSYFGILVSDLMDIPYLHDGCGSNNYDKASSLNPEDFDTFKGYIMMTMPEGQYQIVSEHHLQKVDPKNPYDNTMIFDHATSGLRFHLSLLKLLKDNEN